MNVETGSGTLEFFQKASFGAGHHDINFIQATTAAYCMPSFRGWGVQLWARSFIDITSNVHACEAQVELPTPPDDNRNLQ
jgi:hypothetical protein